MRCGLPPPAAPPYKISVALLRKATSCFGCSRNVNVSFVVTSAAAMTNTALREDTVRIRNFLRRVFNVPGPGQRIDRRQNLASTGGQGILRCRKSPGPNEYTQDRAAGRDWDDDPRGVVLSVADNPHAPGLAGSTLVLRGLGLIAGQSKYGVTPVCVPSVGRMKSRPIRISIP